MKGNNRREGVQCKKFLLCIVVSLLLFLAGASAKSLGTIGATFPIAEADLLRVLENHLLRLQQQGEFDRLQFQFNHDFDQAMDRPPPVAGLSPAKESHTRLFDPSLPVTNVFEPGTALFAPQMNPLDAVSLKEALLFYDADDPHQVRWAAETDQSLQGNTKLILVGGSVESQKKRFQKPVYFDQGGRLKERFQLRHLPTLITQQGRFLKIQEVLLP
jgi:conjugal transfer pilus assembly protein TraW